MAPDTATATAGAARTSRTHTPAWCVSVPTSEVASAEDAAVLLRLVLLMLAVAPLLLTPAAAGLPCCPPPLSVSKGPDAFNTRRGIRRGFGGGAIQYEREFVAFRWAGVPDSIYCSGISPLPASTEPEEATLGVEHLELG